MEAPSHGLLFLAIGDGGERVTAVNLVRHLVDFRESGFFLRLQDAVPPTLVVDSARGAVGQGKPQADSVGCE